RAPLRLVEKTPANCLRIPLLADLFPDGRFIFLMRRPEDTISSLMEGWRRGNARVIFERDSRVQDPALRSARWLYLVPPGWKDWLARPLAEICAFQWTTSVATALSDLQRHCAGRVLLLRHEDALRSPAETYRSVLDFCEIPPSRYFDSQFRVLQGVAHTHGGSAPAPGKWKEQHGREIEAVRGTFADLAREFYGSTPA
ncbi:MAG: sulfotransferase, partial [Gemmatimonadetes bacterium]|nr:sulfotransferase [Gemmatimonadota bacterium]